MEERTAGTGKGATAEAIVGRASLELDAIAEIEVGDGGEISGTGGVGFGVIVIDGCSGSEDVGVVAAIASEGVVTATAIEDRTSGYTTDQLISGGTDDLIAAIGGTGNSSRY